MNVTSTSVATSSSESLPNSVERPNQPKRFLFLKCNYGKISVKHTNFYSTQQKCMVFINLYCKDGHSGKTGAFCKYKSSSLHYQAVEMIHSLPGNGRDI